MHKHALARLELGIAASAATRGTALVATGAVLAFLGMLAVFCGVILLIGDQWLPRDLYWVAALLVAAGFGYGRWYSTRPALAASSRTVLYYVDPMHPWYKSDKPGIAPDCGMKLAPVYADGKVYVTSRDGYVTVVKAGPKFEKLAENRMPDQISASPAISGGRIYLRGFETLYAIGPAGK